MENERYKHDDIMIALGAILGSLLFIIFLIMTK